MLEQGKKCALVLRQAKYVTKENYIFKTTACGNLCPVM